MKLKCLMFLSLLLPASEVTADVSGGKDVSDSSPRSCQQEDVRQELAVKCQDSTFQITVRTNPSTGFDWYFINYSPEQIQPLDAQYRSVYDDPEIVGAPSTGIYTSKVLKTGTVSFDFCYMRNWEGGEVSRCYRFELISDEAMNITGYTLKPLEKADIRQKK
jgi:predicted secreted protein